MSSRVYYRPDLHIHSTYSDGTDDPKHLIENARKAELDLFALTDHDTYEGCAAVQALLSPGDPHFVGGVELSCKDEIGKYHVLGYCYDVSKPSIQEAVAFTHNVRRKKISHRLDYLREAHGIVFPEEEIAALRQLKNPGRPHFVALLLNHGHVKTKAEGFEMMGGYHGTEPHLRPEEAIDAILRADGVPVLAHGILADGSKHLTLEQITERVSRLKDAGLMGVEGYYSTYTPEEKAIMLSLAKEYNLLVTAGSDYHGTNKPIALGQTNDPEPPVMQRFYDALRQLIMP